MVSVETYDLLEDTHPLLAQRMPDFKFDKDRAKELRDILTHNLLVHDALGLAANQIGLRERCFVARLHTGEIEIFFNPVLTELSSETISATEGCLSFDDLQLTVSRPRSCRLIYDDVDGNRRNQHFDGINARVVQHENDHLNGISFTSKVSKLRLNMALKRVKKKALTKR